MRWPWRREARPIKPRRAVSAKLTELETANVILAEVFGARRQMWWRGAGGRYVSKA